MSDRDIKVRVVAQDDASQKLAAIGQNAAKMGQALTAAGKSSGAAMQSIPPQTKAVQNAMADLDREAQKIPATSDDIKKKWTEVGAAAGVLVGGLALVGRAYNEQERQIDGIERAYGSASDEILAFSEEIQRSTVYSNDAARAAALSATSLATNYGLTADQIEEVVRVSADLATVTGIDLADATQRVAGAIRGEGEAAELLNLNMSDAAVQAAAAAAGITGWTTTMTEAEKAAFRYTLVLEQATYAQGAAGDAAETNAGQARQFLNVLQDQAQALGGAIGPAAEYAGVLGSFALAAPVATAGIGRVAAAAKTAGTGLEVLRASSALATVALGPVGLVAAGAAAVVALGSMTDWFGLASSEADEYAEAMDTARAATAALDDTVYGLRNADLSTFLNAQQIASQVEEVTQYIATFSDQYDQYRGLLEETSVLPEFALDSTGLTDLQVEMGLTTEEAQTLAETTNALLQRLDDTGVNASALSGDIIGLYNAYQTNDIGGQELLRGILNIESGFNDTYLAVTQTTVAVDAQTAAADRSHAAWVGWASAIHDVTVAQRAAGEFTPGFADLDDSNFGGEAIAEAAINQDGLRTAADRTTAAILEQKAAAVADHEAFTALATTVGNEAVAAMRAYEARVNAAIDAAQELAFSQQNVLTTLEAMSAAPSAGLSFAQDFDQAAQSLQRSSDLIIGTIGQLRGATNDVADFASGLTGVGLDGGVLTYELAAVDELLASGQIGWNSYRAAVESTEQILVDNARAQSALNEIGVDQIPLLASQTSAYADYLQTIADLPIAEQQLQLAYANTAYTSQLSADAALLADAAMGQLGEGGKQAAADIISAHAQADPALRALYEDAQLITTLPDGTIRVNFPDGESVSQSIGELTDAIGLLTDAIREASGTTIDIQFNDKINSDLDNLKRKIEETRAAAAAPTSSGLAREGNLEGGATPASGNQAGFTGLDGETTATLHLDTSGFLSALGDATAAAAAAAAAEYLLTLNGDAEPAVGEAGRAGSAALDASTTAYLLTLTGDATGAVNAANTGREAGNATAAATYLAKITGDATGAVNAAGTASGALQDINNDSALVFIRGDNSGAINAFNAVNGLTGYATIQINAIRGTGFNDAGLRHGGVVPYRDGGVVAYDDEALNGAISRGSRRFLVGEAGPEIVNLPGGSSVIPAPATRALLGNSGGGRSAMTLNVYGNIYSSDDLQDVVHRAILSTGLSSNY